uniref:Uncharacterized protein n=1 Tax=Avena sativa TaxID=4498 RepID=A0ACD5ZY83_AVESA
MASQDEQNGKTGLLLAFLCVSTSSLALGAAKSPDADAIVDLARSVSNLPPSWTAGADICGYEGVTCDKDSGRVTTIDLRDKGLAGTLPSSALSSLAAVTALHLGGNRLAGAVPSLASLASLALVVLDGNAFTSLPADFLKDVPSLRDLSLDSLPLQPWSLPEAIPSLSLEYFSASAANLAGPFPANLPCSSLTTLRLNRNNLSGPIDAVASLKSLTVLMIDHNSFSGPIPDLSGMSQLETFSAGDNLLTGLVPASMTKMPSLRRVSLANNLLQGPMPEFGHGVDTDVLGNDFCHPEPGRPCDAQVTALLQVAAGFGYPLQLSRNWYGNTTCNSKDGTASWVGVVCNGTDVTEVSLQQMNLSGTISPAFANLTAVVRLNLSGNHLAGAIPDALATMPRLALLDVTNNNLRGQIPKFKPSVQVMAQGNRFGKSVPPPAAGVPAGTTAGSPPAGTVSSSLPANSASRFNLGIIANVILALVIANWG